MISLWILTKSREVQYSFLLFTSCWYLLRNTEEAHHTNSDQNIILSSPPPFLQSWPSSLHCLLLVKTRNIFLFIMWWWVLVGGKVCLLWWVQDSDQSVECEQGSWSHSLLTSHQCQPIILHLRLCWPLVTSTPQVSGQLTPVSTDHSWLHNDKTRN